MKITQDEVVDSETVIHIELEEPDLAPYLDRGYRRVVERVAIPGFRKGKAPRSVVETFVGRESLLNEVLDSMVVEVTDKAVKEHNLNEYYDQALNLIVSGRARNAFDIAQETAKTRDRYGRNEWGEAILTARRRVEAGVRMVTISWMYIPPNGNVANVWDNHGGTSTLGGITGYEMLKKEYCLPSLELGFNALMEDLTDSGLLDETLVVMWGEMGRTPRINNNAVRDHWSQCQSVILAGGGIKGGTSYGATDELGWKAADKPTCLLYTSPSPRDRG